MIISFSFAFSQTGKIYGIVKDADSGNTLAGANISVSGTDLGAADLSQADLKNTDLRTTNLKKAILDGAKYCKTQMPWGEANGDCENIELGGTGFRLSLIHI